MQPLKLHISPCPNDTFMFDAIINNRIDVGDMRFEVEYHDIEELNRAALMGAADITKLSAAALQVASPHYSLLESGAALGRGNGPLFVRRKGDNSPIRSVAVPGLHTTANLLLRRLYPTIATTTPLLFSSIATAIESGEFDAGVLIHEGRFLYAERNLELISDLGEEWESRYNLPLPLGVIVMRKGLDPTLHHRFTNLLRQSIEYAWAHPEQSKEFIKSHAQEMDDKVINSHINLFVNRHSLDLGDEGHRAIEELIKRLNRF